MHTAARTLRSARPSRQHRHRLALLALMLAGTVLLVGTIASNLVLLLRHRSGRSFK